jgi:hypothetical protein
MGEKPETDADERAFLVAHEAWLVAITEGNRYVEPEAVESALRRVGSAESTAEDESLLRMRIQTADLLISQMEGFIVEAQKNAPVIRGVPEGAIHLGGRRWRCPRCNFLAGLMREELECRGCSFPGDDTRPWVVGEDEEAVVDAS